MAKPPNTNALYALAEKIEDYGQRLSLIDLVMGAWENANDTFGGKSVSEAEYEDFSMRSLETLLCYEESETVRAWFKAQGVRW